jgi:site-specific DNA recombinase
MTTSRRRPARRDLTNLTGLRAGLYCRVSRVDEKNKDRLAETGQEKSTEDQEAVGREWVSRQGAVVADIYSDPHRSASRFATKARENFDRLLADIEAGQLDLIWFWELSRSSRRLGVFADLRDMCRSKGVLWVIRDRVYDPASYADMMTLGMLSVIGENESEMTSERVRRGKASSATDGMPAGKIPYGYQRTYNPQTREFLRQEPNVYDGNGRPIEDSPAYIVREIFDRMAAGEGQAQIRRSLETRRIPAPRSARTGGAGKWTTFTIRYIAQNPTYIGQRVHQADSHRTADRHAAILPGVETRWPPLVGEEVFWAVQRRFADPARSKSRPSRAVHLLSCIARCAECGAVMVCHTRTSKKLGRTYRYYECDDWAHAGIKASALDDFAEEVMKRWLSHRDVYAALTNGDDSELAAQARADVERLNHQLEECRASGEDPDADAVFWERRARALAGKLTEAQKLAQSTTLPPVLAGNIGPEAAEKWDNLDLAIQRQIIKATADIRVRKSPSGRGNWRNAVAVGDRVEWRWLLGPDDAPQPAIEPAADVAERVAKAAAAQLAERREKVMRLRDAGWTRAAIAAEIGMSVSAVAKDIAIIRAADAPAARRPGAADTSG